MTGKENRIYDAALQLFDNDVVKAEQWLESPLESLGGQTPKEILKSPNGEESVLEIIGRIEQGVYF